MSIKNNTTSLQELLEKVNNLPNAGSGGVDLPELTNEGAAEDLMLGKELIDANGNVVSGSFTIDSELNTQDSLISQIVTALEGKASVSEPILQSKTVDPSTSSNVVKPDNGYDGLSQVTVNAIPSEYIVPSGTLNITTNGTHDVKNYASATVSIESSSGGSTDDLSTSIIEGTVTTISDDMVKTICPYALYGRTNLTSVNFPSCTEIKEQAFNRCVNLTTANLQSVKTIGNGAFYSCNIITASFPAATFINTQAFYRCYNLKSLYLMGSSICKLSKSDAFLSTPIGGYSASAGTYGSIYVPASLLTSYKAATNWTYFSSRFVGI